MLGMIGNMGGIEIIVSPYMPKHPTRKYKVRYEAHDFIKWLARYLPILPYVEAEYPDDADGFMMGNKLYVGARTFALLQKHTTNQQKE